LGLFDTLLGRTKPVRANLDSLFALPSAAITLQSGDGLVSSGGAGVCWKPPAGQSATDVQSEISQLLSIDDAPGSATGATDAAPADAALAVPGAPDKAMKATEDTYGYRWLLLEDPALDDLVTRVHVVNSTLTDNGWGPQLLCSVFNFVAGPDAAPGTKGLYLVYLYKRGTFYPFAPLGGEKRDTELELRIRAVLGSDLPIESDLSRWFPLWDLPVK
jgi:hypothetical protein